MPLSSDQASGRREAFPKGDLLFRLRTRISLTQPIEGPHGHFAIFPPTAQRTRGAGQQLPRVQARPYQQMDRCEFPEPATQIELEVLSLWPSQGSFSESDSIAVPKMGEMCIGPPIVI